MKIHFIAIGGSMMHNLAIELNKKGADVTGSDDVIYEPSLSKLNKHGLAPKKMGWFPQRITSDIDIVILGMHAREDNLELLKAKQLGLKIYSYPEYIYEVSKNKTRVVIGGSHGKTTVTAMVLHVLNYLSIEVDYAVGAQLENFDTMVHLSQENEFILIEGDEYLCSVLDRRPKFHVYKPNIALLTGISWDHFNVFPTKEIYKEQFRKFIYSLTNGGILVYNQEDIELNEMIDISNHSIKKYSYQTPKHHIENGVTYLETSEGDVPLDIFGKHNLQNIAGSKSICLHMGVGEEAFYEAISSFKGAKGRLEKLPSSMGSIVFKDFAHSPFKVRASLQAVKDKYPYKRCIACLELHTHSSLNIEFIKEYQKSMNKADIAIVYYSPDKLKIKGLPNIGVTQIKDAFQRDDLLVLTSLEKLKSMLRDINDNQSVFLMMSSGNYDGLNFNKLFVINKQRKG